MSEAAPRLRGPLSDWQPGSELRNPRLDGLRGIAIVLVMLYHLTLYGNARTGWDQLLVVIPSVGWSGVDLFFVLSGFLITGILLRAKGGPHYFRSFYARRTLRIFPLYYAVLLFFFVLLPRITMISGDPWMPGADREAWWYWAYLSNVKASLTGRFHHFFLSLTWSLAIEEHFYLIWPLVVWRCSRRALGWACGIAFFGALAVRCVVVWSGGHPLVTYTLTPCRIDTLATGAAIALWLGRPGGLALLLRIARWALPVSFAVAAAGYATIQLDAGLVPGDYQAVTERLLRYTTDPWMRTIGYSVLCVFYGSLLVVALGAVRGGALDRVLGASLLVSAGRYSYAMYLLHLFVAELVRVFFDPGHHADQFVASQLLFWALGIAATYGVAAFVWWSFESRINALKRYFPYGRSA
ncbi:MAG: acyltransferase [Myxococcota bacterium]|nr:acyltransferase [Myxococcota bacterium]